MDGHSIILAIKAGINIMTFGVMPLAILTAGLVVAGIIKEVKSQRA